MRMRIAVLLLGMLVLAGTVSGGRLDPKWGRTSLLKTAPPEKESFDPFAENNDGTEP